MANGVLLNSSGAIVAVVYGFHGSAPEGQTFVPADVSGKAAGHTFAALAQQATALMDAGLAISSTATPAINSTYPCDAAAQVHIQAEMISILANGTFADGATSLAWPDIAGTARVFPSTAAFKSFAVAVAAFVAACYKCINGTSSSLPTAAAAIP